MPTVSVIIPNYNHAPYLKLRIETVLNQTYRDFELIILDDCSTDNSKEIIESYRSNAFVRHIVYNEANSGTTFKQWQKGIALALGDYIWIAESDDWCEPTFLEVLMDGVALNDEIVVGYCGAIVIADDNEILYTSNSKKINEVTDGVAFIKEQLLESNVIFNASMAVFHKETFKQISPEFTTYKFCGDWICWIMMAQKGRVFASGKYLNYFRKHGLDVSGKSMDNGTYYIEYPRIVKYLLDNGLINKNRFRLLLFKKFKSLKCFGGDSNTKKDLVLSFRQMIGMKKLIAFTLADWIHEVKISFWIITPRIIKTAIRTLFVKA